MTTAFHEAMEHAAFSLSYTRAVCKNLKAKNLSVSVENKSKSEKEIEKSEIKELESIVLVEEKKYQAGLWDRYKAICLLTTVSERQKKKILENLQNKEFLSAEVKIFEIENPTPSNKSSPKNTNPLERTLMSLEKNLIEK